MLFKLREQQRSDEKAGEDEEDVDAQEATANRAQVGMVQNDRTDRERT